MGENLPNKYVFANQGATRDDLEKLYVVLNEVQDKRDADLAKMIAGRATPKAQHGGCKYGESKANGSPADNLDLCRKQELIW